MLHVGLGQNKGGIKTGTVSRGGFKCDTITKNNNQLQRHCSAHFPLPAIHNYQILRKVAMCRERERGRNKITGGVGVFQKQPTALSV